MFVDFPIPEAPRTRVWALPERNMLLADVPPGFKDRRVPEAAAQFFSSVQATMQAHRNRATRDWDPTCLGEYMALAASAVASAAFHGLTEDVRRWVLAHPLPAPVDVKCEDCGGIEVLHCVALSAAKAEHTVAIADMLIEAGASLHATDHRGRTPLHYAASRGNYALTARLLRAGANPNVESTASSDEGRMVVTPLELAVAPIQGTSRPRTAYDQARTVETLADDPRCDVNRVNSRGLTPLALASGLGLVRATQVLLEAGADPCRCDALRRTPLHWACERGKAQCALVLARARAPLLDTDCFGSSAVGLARRREAFDGVSFALTKQLEDMVAEQVTLWPLILSRSNMLLSLHEDDKRTEELQAARLRTYSWARRSFRASSTESLLSAPDAHSPRRRVSSGATSDPAASSPGSVTMTLASRPTLRFPSEADVATAGAALHAALESHASAGSDDAVRPAPSGGAGAGPAETDRETGSGTDELTVERGREICGPEAPSPSRAPPVPPDRRRGVHANHEGRRNLMRNTRSGWRMPPHVLYEVMALVGSSLPPFDDFEPGT